MYFHSGQLNWYAARQKSLNNNGDLLIIKLCISEFINFPSIPVKVSMNEYVEISKIYSSPESSNFINGVANNVFKYLTEKNEIKKNERGSQ